MLDIALTELTRCGTEQVLPRELRRGMDEGHDIL
jgi:hypothetical protein